MADEPATASSSIGSGTRPRQSPTCRRSRTSSHAASSRPARSPPRRPADDAAQVDRDRRGRRRRAGLLDYAESELSLRSGETLRLWPRATGRSDAGQAISPVARTLVAGRAAHLRDQPTLTEEHADAATALAAEAEAREEALWLRRFLQVIERHRICWDASRTSPSWHARNNSSRSWRPRESSAWPRSKGG